MKNLSLLSVAFLISLLALTRSPLAGAQPLGDFPVDSFFDVFYEIDLGEQVPESPDCVVCDSLLDEMKKKQAELDEQAEDLMDAQNDLGDAQNDLNQAKKDLQAAQDALDEFNNPRSWVESEGRRTDSTDLQVMRDYNQGLWEQYRNGDLTAEELQEKWNEGLSDAEREKLKDAARKHLEQAVKDIKEDIDDLQDEVDDLQDEVDDFGKKFEESLKKLQELKKRYQECLNRCKEQKVNVLEDFGLRIGERTLLDRFFDLFRTPKPIEIELVQLDLVQLEPIDTDTIVRRGESAPEPGQIVDIELVQLDLTGGPGSLSGPGGPPFVIDSFFDVFFEIEVPDLIIPIPLENIRCVICDPILDKIKQKEAEVAKQKAELDQALSDMQLNGKNLADAKADLQNAKDALDRFNNPRSWVESEDRRLDSSDLEAMREHNRRLWGQYRNGGLSAQELEQAWKDGLSDDAREKIKDEIRDRMKEEVDKQQKRTDDLQKKQDDLEQKAKDLKQKLDECLKKLDALRKEYEDCLKKCVELDDTQFIIGDFFTDKFLEDLVIIPSDGEVTDEETGFFSGIVDWVVEIFQKDTKLECPQGTFPESECQLQCFENDLDCYMKLDEEEYGRECFACAETISEPEDICDAPYFPESGCTNCDGICSPSYKTNGGLQCYECKKTVVEDSCNAPYFPESGCSDCDGVCSPSYKTNGGLQCYECKKTVVEDSCDAPYFPQSGCSDCDGVCSPSYKTNGGLQCYECKETVVEDMCDAPYFPESGCSDCDGICSPSYKTNGGLQCYECKETVVEDSCDAPYFPESGCNQCPYGCDDIYRTAGGMECFECKDPPDDIPPECPTGTVSDQSDCSAQCDNGTCTAVETSGAPCWSCIKCPDGTDSNQSSCSSGCDGTCEVVASEGQLQCWQCKEQVNCEDVCAENDYNMGDTDYSSYILGILNGYSCVSGANISIATATIGECFCSRNPEVSVDQTPPICKGTPCGDVACGQSASCTEGDTTYTVTCNWGGWEKIGENQFRPVVGGQ